MGQQRRRQVASPTGGMLRCVITEVFASVTSDAKRLALCGLQHRGVTEGPQDRMWSRHRRDAPVVQPPHKPHVLERGTT